MKQFSQFNIKPITKTFTGDKIKIDRVLNKRITVVTYKIEKSKFEKGNGNRLCLQIEVDGTSRIIFTGSTILMDMIEQVPKTNFPFTTTIVRESERFEFT